MEQLSKLCSMCRKEIDKAAVLCPYCRSDTSYQYFMPILKTSMFLKKRPVIKYISVFIIFCMTFLCSAIGFIFIGFWGIFWGVLGFIVSFVFFESILHAYGSDILNISCPGCTHSFEYSFPHGILEAKKRGLLNCSHCSQKILIMIE